MKHFLFVLITGCVLSTSAFAQCVDPVGAEGDQVYNPTHKIMQFCDGDQWVGMARAPASSGGSGDNFGSHVAEQDLNASSFKIINLGAPVGANDAVTKAYVDSLTGANESDPQVGIIADGKWCTSNGTLVNCETGTPETPPGLFVAAQTVANDTPGGVAVASAWTTRGLNKVFYNNLTGASLATNSIELPAGTYYIDATVPFGGGIMAQTRIIDENDDDIALLYGSYETHQSPSTIRGAFTLTATGKISVQYYAGATSGATDLGQNLGSGLDEHYTVVVVKKISGGVIADRAATTCVTPYTSNKTCTGTLDPAQHLFSLSGGGLTQNQCTTACQEAGASCCAYDSTANACTGSAAGEFSPTAPPPGWSASLCTDCVPETETKHFFVLGPTDNGNINDGGQSGLPSGDRICLAYLQAQDWKGKEEAVLNNSTVKSFLCDEATCNNLQANKTYAFAVAGNAALGGATFTTDSNGAGPGDAANWSGATYFGSSVSLWMNRATGSGTYWGTTPQSTGSTDTCYGFSQQSSGDHARIGNTNSTSNGRWNNGSATCNTNNRLVCVVDTPLEQGTCNGCRDVDSPSIVAGSNYSCALKQGGQAYCWGMNSGGALGDGTTSNRTTPVLVVNGEGNGKFHSIHAVSNSTCALKKYGGQILCWGPNGGGQTAQGTTSGDTLSPAVIESGASPGTFKQLGPANAGGGVACAIGTDDYAYCWGTGILGDGNGSTTQTAPVKVLNGQSGGKFFYVQAGYTNSCALAMNMKAYCWGTNYNNTPTEIPAGAGPGRYKQIAVGQQHICGLGMDDKAYCWTHIGGTYGEMGNGTAFGVTVPTLVLNGAGPGMYRKLSAGQSYTCGIGTDGNAYCWGKGNLAGQGGLLGNGASTNQLTPVLVNDGGATEQYKDIDTDSGHTCAIGEDDRSYCWGSNSNSKFGNGGAVHATTPTGTSNGANSTGTYRAADPVECGGSSTPGYFVMSDSAVSSDMGGFAGAHSLCLSKLKGYNWLGKDDAALNATTVKPFICTDTSGDAGQCGDLLPNKEYNFAAMGSASTGGATFMTDAIGSGPGDSTSWSGATTFGTTYTYWSNHTTGGTDTNWHTGNGGILSCVDWTDTSAMLGGTAASNNTTKNRWTSTSTSCSSTSTRVICAVDPASESSGTDCTVAGGVEVGGACWFLGDAAETCSAVCALYGGTYNAATLSYAGSGGSNANCDAVLDALHVGGPDATAVIGGIKGCNSSQSDGNRYRDTGATTAAATGAGAHRACACDPPAKEIVDLNCAATGGVPYGNACWYYGAAAANCTTTCAAVNRVYDNATAYAGGSTANLASCTKIMNLLGQTGTANTTWGGAAYGCAKSAGTMGMGSGVTTAAASGGGSSSRACACKPYVYVPPPPGPTTGHLVLAATPASANQGGLAGIDSYCLTTLRSADWMGKSTAALGPSTVKAFACDSATCNNALASTTYAFASTANVAHGGATFTTNASGRGPGNNANWSGAAYFGTSVQTFSNRALGTSTLWGTTSAGTTCSDWSATGIQSTTIASTAYTDSTRWSGANGGCSTNRPFMCMVHPLADNTTCEGKGGVTVGGGCWFLSRTNEGCGHTCANIGMHYDSLTQSYAGGGGSDANCKSVLDALTNTNGATPSAGSGNVGCSKAVGVNGARYRTTADVYTSSSVERACACTSGGSGNACTDAGGVRVAGACWFMGGTGYGCDTVCTMWVGGSYDIATLSYAGSGGSNANCGTVLTALSQAGSGSSTNLSNAGGCQMVGAVRNRGTTATTAAAIVGGSRACACVPPIVP